MTFAQQLRLAFHQLNIAQMQTKTDPGRQARENFETTCWAMQNECLSGYEGKPPVNSFPFKGN